MKIVEIHAHMSVQFGPRKREERFFNINNKRKFENLSLELVPGLGIRATNHEDSVIVPFTNLIAIRTEDESAEKSPSPLRGLSETDKAILGINSDPEAEEDSQPVRRKTKSK